MRNLRYLTFPILFLAFAVNAKAQTYTAEDIANSLMSTSEDWICSSLEQAAEMGLPFALECSSSAITVGLEGDQLVIENTGRSAVRDVRLHYFNHDYIYSIAVDAESESAMLEYVYVFSDWENLIEDQIFSGRKVASVVLEDIPAVDNEISLIFSYYIPAGSKLFINKVEVDKENAGHVGFGWTAQECSVTLGADATYPELTITDSNFNDVLYGFDRDHSEYRNLTFSSSDEMVALIAGDGTVTPLSCGTTTITAHAANTNMHPAVSVSYTLTVLPYQVTGSVEELTLTEPNTLRYVLADLESLEIGSLTLHGKLGSDDLALLNQCKGRLSNLQVLDMSDVTLVADEGTYNTLEASHSDIGMGFTNNTYHLSAREEVESQSEPTGLGGFKVSCHVYTMNLGGLFYENKTLVSLTLPQSVTFVGDRICGKCTKLQSVQLPEGIEEVKEYAFHECANLRSINLQAPKQIDNYAFYKTMISQLNLSQVEVLGEGAFTGACILDADLSAAKEIQNSAFQDNVHLRSVKLGNNLYSIGENAFSNTRLTEVSLPEGLFSIGHRAFAYSKLARISNVPSSLLNVYCESFWETPWEQSQRENADEIIYLGTVALRVNLRSAIPEGYCLTLREGTTAISKYFLDSFSYTNRIRITDLNLPASIKWLGDTRTNTNFLGLTSLQLPEGLQYIGENLFRNAKIKTLTIPSSVTEIGDYAFSECDVITLYLNGTFEGDGVFTRCHSLEKVVVAPDVCSLPNSIFSGCENLLSVKFDENPTAADFRINDYAFNGCSYLRTIDLPSNLSVIGENAFYKTGLKSVVIPAGTDSLLSTAFYNCSSLTTVTLPWDLQYTRNNAFLGCPLTTIYNYMLTPYEFGPTSWWESTAIGSFNFYDTISYNAKGKSTTVYVMPEAYELYLADPEWSKCTIAIMDEEHQNAAGLTSVQEPWDREAIYDLQGRRVNAGSRGIHIIKGKKVIR